MKFPYGSYGYIATRDLDKANKSINFDHEMSALSSQQSIEKICKAFISELNIGDEVERINLLKSNILIKLIRFTEIPTLLEFVKEFREFNWIYFDTLYPGERYYEFEYNDSVLLLELANKVYEIVCTELDRRLEESIYVTNEDIIRIEDKFGENNPITKIV